MSDTPRCDRHSLDMETEELDVELAKTYELAWQLERELNEAKAELVRKDEHDAVLAELLERLRERTESHLAASARDVATIQRQSVEISKWQALTETLATALRDISAHDGPGFPHGTCSDIAGQALAAYDAAKKGEPAYVEIRIYENNDGWPSRRSNLPDPLAEAVKRVEEVSIDPWVEVPSKHAALDGLRNELILAARGESA